MDLFYNFMLFCLVFHYFALQYVLCQSVYEAGFVEDYTKCLICSQINIFQESDSIKITFNVIFALAYTSLNCGVEIVSFVKIVILKKVRYYH